MMGANPEYICAEHEYDDPDDPLTYCIACGSKKLDIERIAELMEVIEAIKGDDAILLRQHIERLKQSDGEGWAIGELTERAMDLLEVLNAEDK